MIVEMKGSVLQLKSGLAVLERLPEELK